MTLTDAQLVLLSAAAQREDHLLSRPETMKGRAAEIAFTALLRKGLAEEALVTPDQPHWRMNEESRPVGLRITSVGLAALGLDPDAEGPDRACHSADLPPAARTFHEPNPRAGTKQARILQLMQREQGATLEELIAATGWLPHTTRAALTGLRKKGYRLARTAGESGATYRILTSQTGADARAADPEA
jgi:hypothetical protein